MSLMSINTLSLSFCLSPSFSSTLALLLLSPAILSVSFPCFSQLLAPRLNTLMIFFFVSLPAVSFFLSLFLSSSIFPLSLLYFKLSSLYVFLTLCLSLHFPICISPSMFPPLSLSSFVSSSKSSPLSLLQSVFSAPFYTSYVSSIRFLLVNEVITVWARYRKNPRTIYCTHLQRRGDNCEK